MSSELVLDLDLERLEVGSPAHVLRRSAVRHLVPFGEPVVVAGGTDGDLLVRLATESRLLGVLHHAIRAGDVQVPAEVGDHVYRLHRDDMARCLHLEIRLLEVADWFERSGGVRFLVVKGPAVAHLDEEDPGLRSFGDVDLLVAPDDFDRAVAALSAQGASRRLPERRPGFDRRFEKSLELHCPDGVEVDLHRTIARRAHGFRVPVPDLFRDAVDLELGGRALRAPSRPHRALHAAYHAVASSGPPSLRTLRDLAGYLSDPVLGPDELVPVAHRWRGTAVLHEAVRATVGAFGLNLPAWERWWASTRPEPAETALLERGRHPVVWPIEWTTLRELGWRDRAAFGWAVAFPSRAHRQAEGRSGPERIRSGLAAVLRSVRPGA